MDFLHTSIFCAYRFLLADYVLEGSEGTPFAGSCFAIPNILSYIYYEKKQDKIFADFDFFFLPHMVLHVEVDISF